MTDFEIYLIDRIKEERSKMTESMARGHGKTLEDYRYAVGIVRGLDVVTSFMIDFNEARKEDDDE